MQIGYILKKEQYMNNKWIDRDSIFNAYSADSASIYLRIQLSYLNGYVIYNRNVQIYNSALISMCTETHMDG